MEKSFFQLIRGLNAIPVHLFIFLLLCGCFLSFVPNPNEEYYVGLTKVFADPQWIPGSFTFAESAGSRLFYNYLLYPLHSVFEFPLVVFLGRLIIITAITFPLSKLYAISKISNLGILLHLPFLYFAKQSYFAGSWIFLSLEPKCFAYVLVFWALYFLLKEKYKIAIFCLIGATYLHILVGGWCAIYFLVTIFFIKEIKHQQKLLLFILYFVSVLPFMFWLKFSVLTAPDTHPSADYIYSYFRSAHHTALAPTWRHFADIHFNGILHTFVVFVFTIFLYQEVNLSGTKKLTLFLLCTLFGSLVLVFVSFLDREGTFLKYYLYRINALSKFLFLFILLSFFWEKFRANKSLLINSIAFTLGLYTFISMTCTNVHDNMNYPNIEEKNMTEISHYIRRQTEKGATILYLTNENNGDGNLSLNRQMERDRLAVFKFVPAQMNLIYPWYQRLLTRNKIRNNIKHLDSALKKYDVNYILSDKELIHSKIHLMVQKGPHYFYSIVQN